MTLPSRSTVQWIGLIGGPVLAALAYVLLPDSYSGADGQSAAFGHAGRATAALAIWMAVWWMTEAIPIFATSLLPLAVLPITQSMSIKAAAAPYAHHLIFLFMGGFILALSMERWGLHLRFAFFSLRFVGAKPANIVGGFMLITAVLSMWVSNTATTIMMLPIAVSVIDLARSRSGGPDAEGTKRFSLCLLLGIAYGASIGGVGTLIGTPPNLFLASFVKSELNHEISFSAWMVFAVPLVIILLPLTWLLLTRLLYPVPTEELAGGAKIAREEYAKLGRMNVGEKVTLVVFVLTALAWVSRPYLAKIEWAGATPLAGLSDAGIAVTAALLLFAIPVNPEEREFTMDWDTAVKLPWGLLLLFGGGLSLAAAVKANGVGEYIGSLVGGFSGWSPLLLVLLVVAVIVFLTELTSNTATTATLVPILAALAPLLEMEPLLLVVPAAVAASCAFMLPVATPPNAIVFGAGHVTISQMCKAGLWLNILCIVIVSFFSYALVLRLLA
jgi:sodium-dependent dicarboxylate transporter 2/3/5